MTAQSLEAAALPSWPYDYALLNALPADPSLENRPRQVAQAYSFVQPTPVLAPKLLAYSAELADELGLTQAQIESNAFAQCFTGNALLLGMRPWALNYGGHQFGHWAQQLGDGRAISLGEFAQAGQRYELQLKGAGSTPYSRFADGRAVLRSSLREFVCSEAMHALGVPTSRALCLLGTGDAVRRDQRYDGNAADEPGAIVCRVAPSFLRFGSFELPSARGDLALTRQLVEFCIARDFPELIPAGGLTALNFETQLIEWFAEICRRTADLLVHWQRVGFVHGVMNTDNLSILGLTIDYGPFGWLESFDPGFTPNTTDQQGRYGYGQQPQVAAWNLQCLARALAPLLPNGTEATSELNEGLKLYVERFNAGYQHMLAGKFGWAQWQDSDQANVQTLWQLMQRAEIDYSLFFRQLALLPTFSGAQETHPSQIDADCELLLRHFAAALYRPELAAKQAPDLLAWCMSYQARTAQDQRDPAAIKAQMDAVNPLYLPRNYLLQNAIDAATAGDLAPLHALQRVLRKPYQAQPGAEAFAERRPEWARNRLGCGVLSCSS